MNGRTLKFLPAGHGAAKGILIAFLVLSPVAASSSRPSCGKWFAGLGQRTLRFSQKHRWKGYGLFLLYAAWKGLQYSNVPSEDDEKYKHRYAYPRQGGVEWNVEETAEELMEAIRETDALLDDVRDYAPRLGSYLRGSKEHQYRTGNEGELHAWVVSRPDNSITLKAVFKRALELNGGRIGAALLCTHELLRNEARFKSSYISGAVSTTDEEQARFFNKFRDIRGDLIESGLGDGDHPGSWYRLFGVALNTYGAAVRRDPQGGLESESRTDDYLFQKFEVSAAEWIKPMVRWPERDLGKAGFNRHSVEVAHELIQKLGDYGATLDPP